MNETQRPTSAGERVLSYETEAEAEFTLESPVRCSNCNDAIERVQVVRMLRTRVNFTSSLPRRGYVSICPSCKTMIPAIVS